MRVGNQIGPRATSDSTAPARATLPHPGQDTLAIDVPPEHQQAPASVSQAARNRIITPTNVATGAIAAVGTALVIAGETVIPPVAIATVATFAIGKGIEFIARRRTAALQVEAVGPQRRDREGVDRAVGPDTSIRENPEDHFEATPRNSARRSRRTEAQIMRDSQPPGVIHHSRGSKNDPSDR